MKSMLLAVLATAAALLAGPVWASAGDFPPLTGDVVDDAHVLSPATRQILTDDLANLRHTTGHRLVVATIGSLDGRDIAAYGIDLFRTWQIGRKGADDGAILLIAPHEHQDRIEVGYGLEGSLTDAASGHILRDVIRPHLKTGDYDGAALAGERAIVAEITPKGAVAPPPVPAARLDAPWWVWLILMGFLSLIAGGVALVVLAVRAAIRSAKGARGTAFRVSAGAQQGSSAAFAARQSAQAAQSFASEASRSAQGMAASAQGLAAGLAAGAASQAWRDAATARYEEMARRAATAGSHAKSGETEAAAEPAAETPFPEPSTVETSTPAWEPTAAASFPDSSSSTVDTPASSPADDSGNYSGGSAGGGGASDSW